MAAFDPADTYARPNPFANTQRHYGLPTDTFRFGVPAAEQLQFFGDTSAQALFATSINKLEALGGIKTEIDFTPFMNAARLLYDGPWLAERFIATEAIITQQPEAMLPVTRTIISKATTKSAVDAFKAEYTLKTFQRQAEQILATVDFIVTPSAGTIFTIEQLENDPIALNTQLGYYTNFMNLLDCAAIAMPAGFLDNGLAWGITLFSTALQDRKLLSYANRWQQAMQLPLGATQQHLPASNHTAISFSDYIPVVVCGAHLAGLPLNWQLRERGAVFAEKTTTSKHYRLYALAGGPPSRPGLIRDAQQGSAIEVEVWNIPATEFASFVAAIPAPLGIGKLELADGRWLPGFICEGYALTNATEITDVGGWRNYIAKK
jgi:allophanate hydrolase